MFRISFLLGDFTNLFKIESQQSITAEIIPRSAGIQNETSITFKVGEMISNTISFKTLNNETMAKEIKSLFEPYCPEELSQDHFKNSFFY